MATPVMARATTSRNTCISTFHSHTCTSPAHADGGGLSALAVNGRHLYAPVPILPAPLRNRPATELRSGLPRRRGVNDNRRNVKVAPDAASAAGAPTSVPGPIFSRDEIAQSRWLLAELAAHGCKSMDRSSFLGSPHGPIGSSLIARLASLGLITLGEFGTIRRLGRAG